MTPHNHCVCREIHLIKADTHYQLYLGVITSLASLATVVGVVASDDVTSFFRTNNGNPAAIYIYQELAQASGTVDETFTEKKDFHIISAEADANEEETSEILAMVVPAPQPPNPTPEPVVTIEPELELELITVEEAELLIRRHRNVNINRHRSKGINSMI